ncbi:hypothetical protein [Dysgonomonas sp. ZJ709]|uniref:hypothetical protein n=1 Tax=Dysgonomonas sp. ZJ709 TaxID=2709797 RepID=UPI0013EA4327|nr:hypothetical protein [Dysgonomonas sp. ZJ709]
MKLQMNRYILKLILGTVLFIFSSNPLSAQGGPYDYDTPLNPLSLWGLHADTKIATIYPLEWGSSATEFDGLVIVAKMQFDPINTTRKLYTFYNQYAEKYLEVFYKENTIMFRRYNVGSLIDYYDYTLYDPLFITYRPDSWTVKFYFTSAFFWIQTNLESESKNYLSPVFFGVNTLQRDNMKDMIDPTDRHTMIEVGDEHAPDDFLLKQIHVHPFKYYELRRDIYTNFSRATATAIDGANFDYD